MSVIKPLPSWAIINRFPAFYEGESLTAIEQTARIYGKINELINTYNRFVTENNAELTELEAQVQKDLSCAIRTIINLTDSYITQVELRLGHQDRKLDEAYKSFTTDITATVDAIIREMKEAGELDETILNALDALNNKFEALQTGVSEEQAALKADYEATKNALDANYEAVKTALEAGYNETKYRLTQGIHQLRDELHQETEANTTFCQNTSVTLAQFTDTDGVGATVPNIEDYSIVGVELAYGDYCICKVHKTSDGAIFIRGTGWSDVYVSNGGSNRVRTPNVAVILSTDGVIVNVEAYIVTIQSADATVSLIPEQVDITRIDGLVLNSGNIS